MFACATATTAVAMFLLGVVKARFTNQSAVKSGAGMLFNGVVAASAAYIAGFALEELMGVESYDLE
jgi:DNA damage-binding protein 1